jgi:hypothetical protein
VSVLLKKLFVATLGAALLWLPAQGALPQAKQPAPPVKENPFTDHTASQLLDQLTAGLVEHNQRKMLGAFDLSKMTDGPLFRQQVTAFFAQTGNVRFHFNILEVSTDRSDGSNGSKGIALVAAEMDAEVREAITPPLRKQAKLRFVAESGPGGWKFTDVQPRAFFSTQP